MRSLANAEVDVMIDAIDSFTERLDTFIERERIFTRDASHELRTPIAVFKGSLDLLQRQSERPPGRRSCAGTHAPHRRGYGRPYPDSAVAGSRRRSRTTWGALAP